MSSNDDKNLDEGHLRHLKRLQVLVTMGVIGGPVSMFIGGIPLSVASFICSLIGFTSLLRMGSFKLDRGAFQKTLFLQSIVAIVICIVALIYNIVYFVQVFSAMMDAYNSGELDTYLNSMMYGYTPTDSSASIWDK